MRLQGNVEKGLVPAGICHRLADESSLFANVISLMVSSSMELQDDGMAASHDLPMINRHLHDFVQMGVIAHQEGDIPDMIAYRLRKDVSTGLVGVLLAVNQCLVDVNRDWASFKLDMKERDAVLDLVELHRVWISGLMPKPEA